MKKYLLKKYHCEQFNQCRFEKDVRSFVWYILFFGSSQIRFYWSCVTIIEIKERNILKRSSIGVSV